MTLVLGSSRWWGRVGDDVTDEGMNVGEIVMSDGSDRVLFGRVGAVVEAELEVVGFLVCGVALAVKS